MSTALYRRYRPESFADVIGQEHVTEPLMQALRSGRVNHAYLFSGPRGCGKTTSARILARCLNCEQGPTDTPCGTCDSCVALARDGAGSVDVIEIDAASHGGVDDARDLRERAAFGPAQARFKVYIIDEAHMVTPNGFNALLKVVEEPPPHVKFIFATTEPEKVLATIRSRTHHYPFHLVPPQRLTSYLEELCRQEGVRLEPGVLSFVTRAGGGSVRDSLSVLDQLISGAGEEGLTYERTAALLGFTDVELLDAVVDAVAARDAATVFQQVDKVMESGHDPRRFVEDLLERYRDLIVLSAVADQAGGLLPGLPDDQVERMRLQAQSYGPAGLSHAADLTARGLSEMAGAVSYRLMLELLVARLLLPTATGEDGYAARLDRLERRLSSGAGVGPEAPARPPRPGRPDGPPQPAPDPQQPAPGPPQPAPGPPQRPASDHPHQPPHPQPQVQDEQVRPGALDTAALRRSWPDILAAVRAISRRTAAGLEQAQVLDFDGRRLLVGFPELSWVRHFTGTSHEEALRQGVLDALALDTRIEATVQGSGAPALPPSGSVHPSPPVQQPSGPAPTSPPAQQSPRPASGDVPPQGQVRRRADPAGPGPGPAPTAGPATPVRVRGRGTTVDPEPAAGPSMAEQLGGVGRSTTDEGPDWSQTARSSEAPAWATPQDDPSSGPGATGNAAGVPAAGGPSPQEREAVREQQQPSGSHRPGQVRTRAAAGAPHTPASAPASDPDWADAPSADDEDLSSSGAVGQPVIETVLGGTVIEVRDDRVG